MTFIWLKNRSSCIISRLKLVQSLLCSIVWLKVYADKILEENDEIAFNAGTHTDMLRIKYGDFVKLTHPVVANFGVHVAHRKKENWRESWEYTMQRREEIVSFLKSLRDEIVAKFETLERTSRFQRKPWDHHSGGVINFAFHSCPLVHFHHANLLGISKNSIRCQITILAWMPFFR